jgi:cell pole-organizing protein PopZ
VTDLAPEKAMEEILHKLQREYAEEGKQQPQAAAAPHSAEVLNLSEAAGDNRKARSASRTEPPPRPEVEAADGPGEDVPATATMGAAAAAIAKLVTIQRERRRASEFPIGGATRTLEDMVREALRPMLQGWLGEKLPEIVERLVRAELSRALGEI